MAPEAFDEQAYRAEVLADFADGLPPDAELLARIAESIRAMKLNLGTYRRIEPYMPQVDAHLVEVRLDELARKYREFTRDEDGVFLSEDYLEAYVDAMVLMARMNRDVQAFNDTYDSAQPAGPAARGPTPATSGKGCIVALIAGIGLVTVSAVAIALFV